MVINSHLAISGLLATMKSLAVGQFSDMMSGLFTIIWLRFESTNLHFACGTLY